jgi:hypothetical protein
MANASRSGEMHHRGQSAKNGTLIHLHEFTGVVEIRRAPNHVGKREISRRGKMPRRKFGVR